MNNTLESSKLFPYAAWAIVVLFALFVYTLTMQLKAELDDISNSVERLEYKLGTKEENIPPVPTQRQPGVQMQQSQQTVQNQLPPATPQTGVPQPVTQTQEIPTQALPPVEVQ